MIVLMVSLFVIPLSIFNQEIEPLMPKGRNDWKWYFMKVRFRESIIKANKSQRILAY